MSTFLRNFTFVLAALSVAAGMFAGSLLSFLEIQIANTTELRLSLTIGIPILLFVSFTWLNRQPAETSLATALQSIGQIAIFLAPYWWVVRHAQ